MLIKNILNKRILVLDGAMGSLIQQKSPSEQDYRGTELKHHTINLKGNYELLNLNCPDLVIDIHSSYLAAGADIITTNTFNANALSQNDYGTAGLCYRINYEACRLALKATKKFTSIYKPRFVAGCIGPTSKSLSMSLYSEKSEHGSLTFTELVHAYREQVAGLIDGGADLLLIETVFDTLNAKAAIYSAIKVMQAKKTIIPLMISATISGESGRILSGQNILAFYHSVMHAEPISVGLNCGFGANMLKPFIKELTDEASCFVSLHPNAGMPDHDGKYNQTPDQMAKMLDNILQSTKVNIIGGCCGTTPGHIEAISELAKAYTPFKPEVEKRSTVLAGLDPYKISNNEELIYIGEKTNVSGSKKFLELISSHNYSEAIDIAHQQIDQGAGLIDICMDAADIDSASAIKNFLALLSTSPRLAKLPVMIDSSDFETITAALQCFQGKPIVNSISLKDGEEIFISKAKEIKSFGAAVVVMLFDERGQANTTVRRTEIIDRSYSLLTEKAGFPPEDIIFDPNIIAVGTDINNTENQAVSFLETCRYIKSNFPGCNITGGISNLSFAFRGANKPRRAIHKVFLNSAKEAGLKFAIVNPSEIKYNNIPDKLIKLAKSVVFNEDSTAIDELLSHSESSRANKTTKTITSWRELIVEERLKYALVNGISEHLATDIKNAVQKYEQAYKIIDKVLMPSMEEISNQFDEGSLFLPAVIRSATVFQKAINALHPYMNSELGEMIHARGKVVIATVEGDVHDIGKNIASIVFECHGYEVIDLGIMVPAANIVETAINKNAEIIGLSGLITPSLQEMVKVAMLLNENRVKIPLLVGGAATSEKHTQQNIATIYNGIVAQVRDASRIGAVLKKLQ